MAENNEGQERTEEPSLKRLQDARDKGNVPRSRELSTMALLLAACACMLWLGDGVVYGLLDVYRESFTFSREEAFDPQFMYLRLRDLLAQSLLLLLPFFGVMAAAALAAPLVLGGWAFSSEALAFKFERIDPIAGLGRIWGWKSVVELVKALAKFLLVGCVALLALWMNTDSFLALSGEPLAPALAHTMNLLLRSFLLLSAVLVVIAAVDVPFQLWEYTRNLRMTRQDMRDEYKETEGSPEVRGRIRSLQREMARRRMMEQVPKADVVVTNPTHYAVALRYDQGKMRAPRVVAKGTGLIAENIRGLAAEHKVAVLSAPPLARALYHSTELEQEIPAGLYLAVAQLLAYVYQLKRYSSQGGVQPSRPDLEELPIPEDLRRDE